MLEKIADIKKALEAKAYLSALSLALTLPDICSKVAYPQMDKPKQNGERYAKWFDEYITKFDYPDDFEKQLKFDGEKCWKLRCAFLHSGNIDGIPNIDAFELSITEPSFTGVYGASCFSISWANDGPKAYTIRLDVAQICFQISACAKGFYNSYADKTKFKDHKITILDINAEANKISDLNK